jgi:fatty acid desaturase
MYLSRPELRELRKRSSWHGIWLVSHAWGTIFGAMALFAWIPNPLTLLLAIMVIGTRQLGLAILMHDASHGLLFPNQRINDLVANWFCAYPTLVDVLTYRPYHLVHHRHTLQDNDPDLPLSAHFPITRSSFWRKTIRDLTGQTFVRQYGNTIGPQQTDVLREEGLIDTKRVLNLARGPLITNLVLLSALALAGYWWLYPLLWILPMATWRMWVTRIRNIAEHAVIADRNNPLKHARTTLANMVERLFIAPYFVNYHLEHHLYMWIPCYNLPKAHKLLKTREIYPEMEVRQGYWGVLRDASNRPQAVKAA